MFFPVSFKSLSPEGVLPEKLVFEVCGPLLKTLTLFMTSFCGFCYPCYDPTKDSDTLFKTVEAGTVALNISYEGLLMTVLLIMMKSSFL